MVFVMYRHRGISLIKLVVGMAAVTGGAIFFANCLLAPLLHEAEVKEKMRASPDYMVFAENVVFEVQTNHEAAWRRYNGKVVSVTGVVKAVSGARVNPSVNLGGIQCHFEGTRHNANMLHIGSVASIRGMAAVTYNTLILNQCAVRADIKTERAFRDSRTPAPETPAPAPLTTRQIQQRNAQTEWNRSRAAGLQDGPTRFNLVRQR